MRTHRLLTCCVLVSAFCSFEALAAATMTVGNTVNVTKLAGHQSEAAIAINPTNTANLVVCANTDLASTGITKAFTTDGGKTWVNTSIATGSDAFTPSIGDPTVAFDTFGNCFVGYLELNGTSCIVLLSTDGGATFTQIATVGSISCDQPTLVTGPGPTPTTRSVWVSFQDSNNNFVASGALISGLGTVGSFSTPQAAPGSNGCNFGDITIGPNGQVTVCFQEHTDEAPGRVFVCTDPDGLGPAGFGAAVTVVTTNCGDFDYLPAQNQRGVDSQSGLAYDRSGGQFNGRLYFVYTDENPDESNDFDIFLMHSNDNGATWSTPVRVNDDTTRNSQFLCHVAVDQTTGAVAVVFLDSRLDSGAGAGDTNGVANDDATMFATVSVDGGLTFAQNVQITSGISNAAGMDPGIEYGDYLGLCFHGGVFHAAWADNSNSTGNNPDGSLGSADIYTVAVTVSGVPPPPPPNANPVDLIVQSLLISGPGPNGSPIAGQPFSVTARIGNIGTGTSSGSEAAIFLDLTVPYPTNSSGAAQIVSVPAIVAGGFADVTFTITYPAGGNFNLAVLADSGFFITETSELNNVLAQQITVYSQGPDLLVQSVSVAEPNPGIDATFTVQVFNRGNTASTSYTLGFYANRFAAPSLTDTPDQTQAGAALPPGGVATFTFTLPTQNVARAGTAWFFADSSNTVAEDIETNNTSFATWGIANDPPVLTSGISSSVSVGTIGQPITFTAAASDPNGDTLSYFWDFGDGTTLLNGPSVTHTYTTPGFYTVTMTLSDGPFHHMVSTFTVEIESDQVVDLGTISLAASHGRVKFKIPLPAGMDKYDRVKSFLLSGDPGGAKVHYRNLRLNGKVTATGVYRFTIEFNSRTRPLVEKTKFRYTVTP